MKTRITDVVVSRIRSTVAVSLLVPALVACSTAATAPPAAQPAAVTPDSMHGTASWYGEEFAGRTTANGEVFEPLLLTAAHRTLPFGTVVEVRNRATGQRVRVRINDRGPMIADRLIDLSYAAAKEIGIVESGSGDVDVTVVSLGRGDKEPPAPYTVALAKPQRGAAATAAAPAPAPVQQESAPAVAFVPPPTAAPAVTATAAPAPAVTTTAAPAPAPAPAEVPAPAPALASSEPPPVDFPLPSDVARGTPAPAVQAAPAPAPKPAETPIVKNVEVIEERKGVETRRQVGSDGRSIQSVAPESGRAAAASPTSGTAEALDKGTRATARAAAAAPKGRQFSVQVGAFSVEANAKALVELLGGFGMNAHVDHDTLYRVRIGPFATREEALQTRASLEAKGVSALIVTE